MTTIAVAFPMGECGQIGGPNGSDWKSAPPAIADADGDGGRTGYPWQPDASASASWQREVASGLGAGVEMVSTIEREEPNASP